MFQINWSEDTSRTTRRRPFWRRRQAIYSASLYELPLSRVCGWNDPAFLLLPGEDQMESVLANRCSFNFTLWLWFVFQFQPVWLTLADRAFGDRNAFLASGMIAEQRTLPLVAITVWFRESFGIFVAIGTQEYVCTAMELGHWAAQITLECNEAQGVLWTREFIFDAELC